MTSKLTREQVVALIAEHSYDSALVDALEYLLAAMDSEPVYQVFEPSDGRWVDVDDEEEMIRLRSIGGETRTLYTAPPSTVVDSEPVAWEVKGILCHTLEEASKYVGVPEPLYAYPRLESVSAEPVAYMYDGEDGVEYNGHNEFSGGGKGIPLYRHAQQPVVPPMQHWEELCREYPDMSIGDAIIRAAWWNHCRAAMLQTGTLTNEDTRQVDELTMWVKRLVRSLKKASPDSKLHSEAMDYLTTKGLISVGDALR